jgi:hypothetical protein
MDKKLMYLLTTVGGAIGSYGPVLLFHANSFGAVSVLGGMFGGIAGILLAYKLSQ